jgi:drug/metabolite transporter (DMT)-like permease
MGVGTRHHATAIRERERANAPRRRQGRSTSRKQHVPSQSWRHPLPRPVPVLVLGILAVSSAAVLISLALARGASALAIAALRMGIAAAVVAPVALTRSGQEIRALRRGDALFSLLSGFFLAVHFAAWTTSLDETSVMSSVVLVSTNPLFVAGASALFLGEKPGRLAIAGILAAAAGSVVVGLADLGEAGRESLRGDLLAVLGAIAGSGYLLVGRKVRARVSLTVYVGISYTTAACLLLGLVAATRTPLAGLDGLAWLWIALLAVGPQLIGHTSYNWALRYVTATLVTVTLLAEPIGATLLAIPVLGQVPGAAALAGALLILAGIWMASRAEARAGPAREDMEKLEGRL